MNTLGRGILSVDELLGQFADGGLAGVVLVHEFGRAKLSLVGANGVVRADNVAESLLVGKEFLDFGDLDRALLLSADDNRLEHVWSVDDHVELVDNLRDFNALDLDFGDDFLDASNENGDFLLDLCFLCLLGDLSDLHLQILDGLLDGVNFLDENSHDLLLFDELLSDLNDLGHVGLSDDCHGLSSDHSDLLEDWGDGHVHLEDFLSDLDDLGLLLLDLGDDLGSLVS